MRKQKLTAALQNTKPRPSNQNIRSVSWDTCIDIRWFFGILDSIKYRTRLMVTTTTDCCQDNYYK